MRKSKKGQISLNDAPMIVMVVGLVFLIMATIALVSEKYGDSMPTSSVTVTGEVITPVADVAKVGACNFGSLSITTATNSTGILMEAGNYTVSGATVTNTTETINANAAPWTINYTYVQGGVACNVTADLNTEISNNTSIAGIVLTISLVGIVLSVLVGVFVGMRKEI